jgi:hypothetical protein
MTEATTKNLEIRIAALEIRLGELANLVQLSIGAAQNNGPAAKASKKMSKAEKEIRTAELMDDAPYTKKQLEEMPVKDIRFIGKASGLNTFGMDKKTLIMKVFAAQKKPTTIKK